MSSRIWLRRRTTWAVCGTTRRVCTLPFFVRVLLLDGVLDEVVGGGRLGNAGEEGVLGEREVLEVLLPVALGGGCDAVAAVAVVVVVEVGLHDRLLAGGARVGLGQADRLDDLARLALVHAVRERALGQEPGSHELLGDGGAAAVVALDRVDGGCREGDGIEARVLPERLVLDRGRGIHEDRRDLVEGHELPAVRAEAGQQHLAGPVPDGRLLVEVDALEGLLGVRQILREVRVARDEGGGAGDAHQGHRGEQEERDGECHVLGGTAATRAAPVVQSTTALPPGEAGLHCGRNDTMRGMDTRSSRPGRTMDGPGPFRVTRG